MFNELLTPLHQPVLGYKAGLGRLLIEVQLQESWTIQQLQLDIQNLKIQLGKAIEEIQSEQSIIHSLQEQIGGLGFMLIDVNRPKTLEDLKFVGAVMHKQATLDSFNQAVGNLEDLRDHLCKKISLQEKQLAQVPKQFSEAKHIIQKLLTITETLERKIVHPNPLLQNKANLYDYLITSSQVAEKKYSPEMEQKELIAESMGNLLTLKPELTYFISQFNRYTLDSFQDSMKQVLMMVDDLWKTLEPVMFSLNTIKIITPVLAAEIETEFNYFLGAPSLGFPAQSSPLIQHIRMESMALRNKVSTTSCIIYSEIGAKLQTFNTMAQQYAPPVPSPQKISFNTLFSNQTPHLQLTEHINRFRKLLEKLQRPT